MTRGAAAANAGIDPSLMTRWCDRYSSFSSDCAIAEHEFERNLIAGLLTAAKAKAKDDNDPKYLLEVLKRRFPADWGDRIDVKRIDDDTLLRLLTADVSSRKEEDVEFPVEA